MRRIIRINLDVFCRCMAATSFICMSIISFTFASMGITGLARSILMMLLCYLPLGFVLLRNIRSNHKQFPFDYLGIVLILLVLFLVSKFMGNSNSDLLSNTFTTNILSLYRGSIAYLFIRLLYDTRHVKRVLLTSAYIFLIYYGIQGITALTQGYWLKEIEGQLVKSDYDMSFGYGILFPLCIFGYYGLKEKNVFLTILFAICFVGGFSLGSRASSVSAVLFLLLYILFIGLKDLPRSKKFALVGLFIILIVIILAFWKDILMLFEAALESLGSKSRTLTRLMDGSFTEDAIRGGIYSKTWSLITQKPYFGYGYLSDVSLLGNYAHNIVLELLLDFGFIGGGLLTIAYFVWIIRMLFKTEETEWRGLFVIFISMIAIRLMVSYSVTYDMNFWMLLGLFITYRKNIKKTRC